jgi:hypothetical protein
MSDFNWIKKRYFESISSKCWAFTSYSDPDRKKVWQVIKKDTELEQIVKMETRIGNIPSWARKIALECIDQMKPCGGYEFPLELLEVLDSIGKQSTPILIHGCFVVEKSRKMEAEDYCKCLEAWLAGKSPDITAIEVEKEAWRKIEWKTVCKNLWDVIGVRSPGKVHAIEYLTSIIRYQIKNTFYDDDALQNPHVKFLEPVELRRMYEKQLSGTYQWLLGDKHHGPEWWLCAPKAFRFLERMIWQIGKNVLPKKGNRTITDDIPAFLLCEDTYPNQDTAADWFKIFTNALDAWWQEKLIDEPIFQDVKTRLGSATPEKQWLVRLYRHRLRKLVENGGEFSHLVAPAKDSKHGTRPLLSYVESLKMPEIKTRF